ncbi:MAG: hypothetical protein SFU27_00885 [Thermonemataceae bacterium]|nr:hypothetical protein [Thermonemataceae bacterium]
MNKENQKSSQTQGTGQNNCQKEVYKVINFANGGNLDASFRGEVKIYLQEKSISDIPHFIGKLAGLELKNGFNLLGKIIYYDCKLCLEGNEQDRIAFEIQDVKAFYLVRYIFKEIDNES